MANSAIWSLFTVTADKDVKITHSFMLSWEALGFKQNTVIKIIPKPNI